MIVAKYEQLPVELTHEELEAKRKELASLFRRDRDAEQEKKDATKRLGEELKSIRQDLDNLEEQCTSGRELREVEVVEQADPNQGIMRVIRIDTGEVVSTRPLTADERQVAMFPQSVGRKRSGKGSDSN